MKGEWLTTTSCESYTVGSGAQMQEQGDEQSVTNTVQTLKWENAEGKRKNPKQRAVKKVHGVSKR
jgi:hypothetical protein